MRTLEYLTTPYYRISEATYLILKWNSDICASKLKNPIIFEQIWLKLCLRWYFGIRTGELCYQNQDFPITKINHFNLNLSQLFWIFIFFQKMPLAHAVTNDQINVIIVIFCSLPHSNLLPHKYCLLEF